MDKEGNKNSKRVCSNKIKNGADSCASFAIYEDELKPLLFEVFNETEADAERRIYELEQQQLSKADFKKHIDTIRRGLWSRIAELQSDIAQRRFAPVCLYREGKPLEFSYRPIAQYGGAAESRTYPTFSDLVKHVKKPAGARPGMVTYAACRTLHVTPEEELVRQLAVK